MYSTVPFFINSINKIKEVYRRRVKDMLKKEAEKHTWNTLNYIQIIKAVD